MPMRKVPGIHTIRAIGTFKFPKNRTITPRANDRCICTSTAVRRLVETELAAAVRLAFCRDFQPRDARISNSIGSSRGHQYTNKHKHSLVRGFNGHLGHLSAIKGGSRRMLELDRTELH